MPACTAGARLCAFLEHFACSWQKFHQEIEEIIVVGDRAALMIT